MELIVLLAVLGLLSGFLAGWVGLGGGIILGPLLLYVPTAVGLGGFDMKEVARLTMIQSLCSTASAGLAHSKARLVNGRLVLWMGTTIAMASLGGAILSERQAVSSDLLLGLFAAMALLGAMLMLRRPLNDKDEVDLDPNGIPFRRAHATMAALSVGLVGGMVGQSGAFLTIPLLIHVLRMPVRVAIGSSLGITFCAALAGSFGKLVGGGPIVLPHVAALVAGSLLGSQLGSAASHRLPATSLRYGLAILIGASAVRMCWQLVCRTADMPSSALP